MITNSKQSWAINSAVRVGFLSLVVKAAIPTPGDFAADAYLLTNAAGDKIYSFVPHKGVTRISAAEATEMLATAKRHAARVAAESIERAQSAAHVSQIFTKFNEIFTEVA